MFQLCFNLDRIHDTVGRALKTASQGRINLASQGLLLPHGATAKTLVPSGHVNPQILGVIRIAASLPLREEW